MEDQVLDFGKIIPTLGDVFRRRFTGALRLDSEVGTRVFYLKDGNLISIGTTIDKEKIDEILIRDRKLTKEHIKEALEKSNSFAQIGKQLVAFGFLKQEELDLELKKQANIILYNVLKENDGRISFIEGHEPTRTDVFYYPTHLWLFDFIMNIEERDLVFKLLPPLNHFIGKEPELEEFLEILPWDDEDKELALKLNGSFTVAEATSYSRKKEMDVYKKLAYLNSFSVIKSFGESQKKPSQAPLFSPLEVEKEVPPVAPANVDFPVIRKHKDRKRRLFYFYPLVGSIIVILILGGIFIYHAYFSKPSKPVVTPPIYSEEKKQAEKVEEESDTMVLTPQKIEPLEKKETVEQKKEKEEPTKLEEKKEVQKAKIEEAKEEKIPPKKEEIKKEEPKIERTPLYEEAINYLNEAKGLPQNYFTIQILIACQEETIFKLKKNYPDLKFWYIPIIYQGKNCYKVFYEKAENKDLAEKIKGNLPDDLLKNKPQIVSISMALKGAK